MIVSIEKLPWSSDSSRSRIFSAKVGGRTFEAIAVDCVLLKLYLLLVLFDLRLYLLPLFAPVDDRFPPDLLE